MTIRITGFHYFMTKWQLLKSHSAKGDKGHESVNYIQKQIESSLFREPIPVPIVVTLTEKEALIKDSKRLRQPGLTFPGLARKQLSTKRTSVQQYLYTIHIDLELLQVHRVCRGPKRRTSQPFQTQDPA
jgi:hypothetical protein